MHLVVSTEEPNTQTAEEMCPTLCAPLESSKKDIRDPDDRERKQALVERGCRLIKSKQQNGKQTKLYFDTLPRSAMSRRSLSQAGFPDLGQWQENMSD